MEAINWIAANWWPVVKVILVFGLLIFSHEFGHFFAAKKVGVRVHEFALGMGPKIWGFKKDETEYSIRLFPVGGFVNIEGEDEKCSNPDDQSNFQNKSVGQRAIIIASGCIMNYIMALLLFFIVAFFWGEVKSSNIEPTNRIYKLVPGSPAERAGIQPKDKIIAIDQKTITDGKEMVSIINKNPEKKLIFTVERKNKKFDVPVVPYKDKATGEGKIGIFYDVVVTDFIFEKTNFIGAVKFSLQKTFELTVGPIRLIYMLIIKEIPAQMVTETSSGPVGIMQMTFVLAKKGLAQILFFAALLNVALGFFNLIPFPALDGSRLLFLAVEGIRKKPIPQEKEGMVHWVGLIILLCLVALVTFQDIMRILQGRSFFK